MKSVVFTAAMLATLAALTVVPAHAVEYNQVQPGKSAIQFTFQQMGVKMDGRFGRFSSQLSFDPANPAAARATIDVDLASVDAGSSDADQEVVGKAWFDTKAFPSARFVSANVKLLGGNRYDVAGKLTIKGRTHDIVIPASFAAQGGGGIFEGSFTIRRGDFNIGEGIWAKFDVVANEVQVRFRITATSSK